MVEGKLMKVAHKTFSMLAAPFLYGVLALAGTTAWAEGDPDVDAPLAALPMPIPAPPDNPIPRKKSHSASSCFSIPS